LAQNCKIWFLAKIYCLIEESYKKSTCDNLGTLACATTHRSYWNYNATPTDGAGVFMLRVGDKILVNGWQNAGELRGQQISLLVSDPVNYGGWSYNGFRATHIWGSQRFDNYGEAVDPRPSISGRPKWYNEFYTQDGEYGEVQANFIRDDLSAVTKTSIYWEDAQWLNTMTRLKGSSVGTYIPNNFVNE
jgi:hypothetical protein